MYLYVVLNSVIFINIILSLVLRESPTGTYIRFYCLGIIAVNNEDFRMATTFFFIKSGSPG